MDDLLIRRVAEVVSFLLYRAFRSVNELMFAYENCVRFFLLLFFFFQSEYGIRDLLRSRGLGDVYKRQALACEAVDEHLTRRVLG